MKKRYLVTGAAGFIGSRIAAALLQRGCEVVTIDNLTTGKRENVPDGCVLIEGDVFARKIIDSLEQHRFDGILHIAGQSSGEVSFDDPVYDLQTNAQSTLMLLDYAKKTGCRNFLYASSMSTYGDHENPLVDEESKTQPKSFYAVGKLASENYMRIFTGFGIQCTALRFFNVYGVGQNMDNLRQGMASIFLAMALKDRHVLVKGSKDRFRDFVYIDDVVDAVLKALHREQGEAFEVYNVSTGIPQTVETIIETIRKVLPYEVAVEYTSSTPGDQFGIYGSNEKIRKELGWTPQIDFQTGMKKMIEWAQK